MQLLGFREVQAVWVFVKIEDRRLLSTLCGAAWEHVVWMVEGAVRSQRERGDIGRSPCPQGGR